MNRQLESFMHYCATHPDQRFWQALRNWSQADCILWLGTRDDHEGGAESDLQDTFYWDYRNHHEGH